MNADSGEGTSSGQSQEHHQFSFPGVPTNLPFAQFSHSAFVPGSNTNYGELLSSNLSMIPDSQLETQKKILQHQIEVYIFIIFQMLCLYEIWMPTYAYAIYMVDSYSIFKAFLNFLLLRSLSLSLFVNRSCKNSSNFYRSQVWRKARMWAPQKLLIARESRFQRRPSQIAANMERERRRESPCTIVVELLQGD